MGIPLTGERGKKGRKERREKRKEGRKRYEKEKDEKPSFASVILLLMLNTMSEKKNSTKNFILRLDASMMEAIEAWAADEFRSTNGQIQWILSEALKKAGRMKKKKAVQ